MDNYARSILFEQTEEVVQTLGEGYLASILAGSGFSKSALILSDKRVYQRGVQYKFFNNRPVKMSGSSVVNLEDVTGSDVVISKNYLHYVFFILAGSQILYFLSIIGSSVGPIVLAHLAVLIISAALGFYFLTYNYQLFTINYPGGSIAINATWFAQRKILDFQKAITRQKELLDTKSAKQEKIVNKDQPLLSTPEIHEDTKDYHSGDFALKEIKPNFDQLLNKVRSGYLGK